MIFFPVFNYIFLSSWEKDLKIQWIQWTSLDCKMKNPNFAQTLWLNTRIGIVRMTDAVGASSRIGIRWKARKRRISGNPRHSSHTAEIPMTKIYQRFLSPKVGVRLKLVGVLRLPSCAQTSRMGGSCGLIPWYTCPKVHPPATRNTRVHVWRKADLFHKYRSKTP